ncbi:hypothetical protein Pelo_16488 [Pelomyxa schiedti]|nr:hypothetical protein Pelo_16488 [Pelomyxa schiedti]
MRITTFRYMRGDADSNGLFSKCAIVIALTDDSDFFRFLNQCNLLIKKNLPNGYIGSPVNCEAYSLHISKPAHNWNSRMDYGRCFTVQRLTWIYSSLQPCSRYQEERADKEEGCVYRVTTQSSTKMEPDAVLDFKAVAAAPHPRADVRALLHDN